LLLDKGVCFFLNLDVQVWRDHTYFSAQSCRPQCHKDMDLIEWVQERETKCWQILDLANKSYEQWLQSLNLPTLEMRQLRGDLI
jgi:hypothetical protein